MAEALTRDGLTVHVALLAGHGTSPEDLARTSWKAWVASAEQALLALHLAAAAPVDAVIAMATPLRLRSLLHRVARVAQPVLPYAPVVRRVGPRSPDVLPYRASYPRIPLGAMADEYRTEASKITIRWIVAAVLFAGAAYLRRSGSIETPWGMIVGLAAAVALLNLGFTVVLRRGAPRWLRYVTTAHLQRRLRRGADCTAARGRSDA